MTLTTVKRRVKMKVESNLEFALHYSIVCSPRPYIKLMGVTNHNITIRVNYFIGSFFNTVMIKIVYEKMCLHQNLLLDSNYSEENFE